MILYLHIGTEKTGTTSIQRFFANNREPLAKNGIFYPRTLGPANHLALATYANKRRGGELWQKMGIENRADYQNFRARMQRELAAEMETFPVSKTIMSNEHCSSRLKSVEEIEDLRQFLAAFADDIYIVVYLRRQDDFVVSTYSTAIKTGHSQPLTIPNEAQIARRYDYWELLSRWAEVFGNDKMICRKFEKGSLIDNDVVRDALHVMGVDERPEYERLPDANVSLDAACLEFLRLMNKHTGPDWKSGRTIAHLNNLSNGPLIDLSPDDRRALMERLRESNALVARKFFGGELTDSDDPLFRQRSDSRPRTFAQGLDADGAVAIASKLLAMRAAARAEGKVKRSGIQAPKRADIQEPSAAEG